VDGAIIILRGREKGKKSVRLSRENDWARGGKKPYAIITRITGERLLRLNVGRAKKEMGKGTGPSTAKRRKTEEAKIPGEDRIRGE